MNSRTLMSVFALMAMSALTPDDPIFREEDKIRQPKFTGKKAKVCPRGCNHYHFNHEGEFVIGEVIGIIKEKFYAFECFAINDKSAIKKFNKRNKR